MKAWTISDARRQVARVWVDTGVVVENGVVRLEMDAGRDPPPADGQERQSQRAVRRRGARTDAGRGRDSGRRPGSGKRPISPHFFWCSSMKGRGRRAGPGRRQATSPTASARRTLRRIS